MTTIEFKSNLTKTENKCSKCNRSIVETDLYCSSCGFPANYSLIRQTINSLNLESKSKKEARGIKRALILIGLSELIIGIVNFGVLYQLLFFAAIGITFIGISFRSKREPLLITNLGVILYILALTASFAMPMEMPFVPFVLHLVILPLIISCYSRYKKFNKASMKLKKLQHLN